MAFVDRLVPFLQHGDAPDAAELLSSLSGDELHEAKEWFATKRRWLNAVRTLDYIGNDDDERRHSRGNAEWIVGLCALTLCGPVTAARRVPWG